MLHKPAGVVSATEDPVSRTVLDLIRDKQRKDLFPVGRLDKDTEGLLLITNDGVLAHQLLSPKKHVDKVYFARVNGKVTAEDQTAFSAGVDIGEEALTLPAKLNILKSDETSEIELTIQEGKYHQVKRMFEAVGKEVIYLKRLSMGSLVLDPKLAPGDYRELTDDELESLKSSHAN
jgi:16S rRNA pseudouridine516 synthase